MIEIKILINETKLGRTQIELKMKADGEVATAKEVKASKEIHSMVRDLLHLFALTKTNPTVAETKEDIATLRSMEDIDLI